MTDDASTTALARLRGNDGGLALVLVLGMTAAVAALMVVTVATASRALRSSSGHVNFEGALAVAEAGVDQTLAATSQAFNSTPSMTFVSAAPCNMQQPAVAQVATAELERTWAKNGLLALPPSCTKTVPGGQFVAARPAGRQAVYSMGWSPSRSHPDAKRRLLKSEYIFAPYKPSNAVLTGSNLDFSGSVAITSPTASIPASVHTNSNIIGFNNSLEVAGAVTASGTLPGSCPSKVTLGCAAAAPQQGLPTVDARSVYTQRAASYSEQWFDLCPDGRVKTAGAMPCTGVDIGGSGSRGWLFTPGSSTVAPVWTLPRTAGGPFPGIYYVFQGDAKVGNNGNSSTTWQISVLAEAKTGVSNTTTCGKLGGNIQWKLFNLKPMLPGLIFLADANLTGDANSSAGSGLFLAGDKVDLQTSSATLRGAVIAANKCAAQGANSIQGVTIDYDDSSEGPISDVIRTTLWLEYAAN